MSEGIVEVIHRGTESGAQCSVCDTTSYSIQGTGRNPVNKIYELSVGIIDGRCDLCGCTLGVVRI